MTKMTTLSKEKPVPAHGWEGLSTLTAFFTLPPTACHGRSAQLIQKHEEGPLLSMQGHRAGWNWIERRAGKAGNSPRTQLNLEPHEVMG